MRNFSFILLFMCSICWSQNERSFSILNKDFSYSYDEPKRVFSICHKQPNSFFCKTFNLQEISDDDFKLPNKIKEEVLNYFNDQEFNVLGVKKMLGEFNKIQFDSIKINIDFSILLDEDLTNDTLKIDGALKNQFLISRKKNDSTYVISYPDDDPSLDLSFEVTLAQDLNERKNLFQSSITDVLNKKLDNKVKVVEEFSKFILNKFNTNLSEFYKKTISKSENYAYLTSEELVKSDSTENDNFTFYYLIKNNFFHLKVVESDSSTNVKIYNQFKLDIVESEFISSFYSRYNQFDANNSINRDALRRIYLMLKIPVEKKIEKNEKKEFDNELLRVIDSIENEKETFSGQFTLSKKIKVKYSELLRVKCKTFRFTKCIKYAPYVNKEFIIKEAAISLFNNRVDQIAVVGSLKNGNDKKSRVLLNKTYSLPIREFNNGKQTNVFYTDNGKYKISYDDVLDYIPLEKFNYSVKNGELKLNAGDTVRVKERKLSDYFTGIIFSDFLGLNSNNNNNLIVAEGRIRLPWNLRNMKRWTIFDNTTAYVSVNLFSNFQTTSRKVELESITIATDEEFEEENQKFETDNFNQLLNNNIDAGIQVTPLTFEWKGASTFIHLKYGVRFLRTGVSYDLFRRDSTTIDSITTVNTNLLENKSFQVYSLGHELELNFEIRPQINLGADLAVGLNWFRTNGTNKNNLNFRTTNNSPNLKVLANIYSLTNPNNSKSGVFFRLGGYYNLGNYKFFPQVMVGYATNLTSFVNKLQSKKK